MIDLLLKFGLSNLCLSALMAAAAWTIQKKTDKPLLAHLLWLLVLVKLVTPAFLTVPLLEVPTIQSQVLAELEATKASNRDLAAQLDGGLAGGEGVGVVLARNATWDAHSAELTKQAVASSDGMRTWKTTAVMVWLVGTLSILLWSLWRVWQFHRLLKVAARPAEPRFQLLADQQAQQLGMRCAPTVLQSTAQIPPMVWWLGSRTRIVLPDSLIQALPADELRWLIAHEVAHVRRRDHWVRWMEWLACIAFWWNPITWIARKHLRVMEEICCDALVLRSLKPNPKTYANSLLNAVELLLEPLHRPPAMASEVNSGGALEKRLKMIIRNRTFTLTPRWVNLGVLLSALLLLPLGVAHAQEPNTQAVAKRLITSVQAGEITEAQAKAMMGALAEQRFSEQLASLRAQKSKLPYDRNSAAGKQRQNSSGGGMMEKYYETGVSNETYSKVIKAVHSEGVKREVLEPVMGIMLRSIYMMREGGEESGYKRLDAKMTELGLTRPQSETVFGLAKKLAHALELRDDKINQHNEEANRRGYDELHAKYQARVDQIKQEVGAGNLSPEEAREKLLKLRQRMEVAKDQHAEKKAQERSLRERGDYQRQREVYERQGEDYQRQGEDYDRNQLIQRRVEYLRQAVKDGEMPKEEAQKRLDQMAERINREHEKKAAAVQKAYEAGKMSREEAHEVLQKIREQMGDLGE